MAIELKVEDKIDYSKLKKLANAQRTILVGHEGQEAEIAKKLYFGGMSESYISPRGKKMAPRYIPARNYLTDGFLRDEDGVRAGVQSYYEGLFLGRGGQAAQTLANKIKGDIQAFVIEDNPYQESMPNAKAVIADKGFNHPLYDQGNLMKSMVGKVITE